MKKMRLKQLYIKINKPKFLSENWFFERGKNIEFKFIDINFWYDSNTDNLLVEGSFEIIFLNFRILSISWNKKR